MRLKHFLILVTLCFIVYHQTAWAQVDTAAYKLTIRQETVDITGKKVTGMTINGTIPGPTLRFKEGDYAVIFVTNEMDTETSVHWHGFILPNFFDGVPYLTTPPIKPGETFKYEFHIKQSGTYWYHSHTFLQEQSGVYGSIIIDPKVKTLEYDSDLVLVLSDWTNQKPINVLRNLKRGNEWYGIKKGTATPLSQVIARGAFKAQLNFWKQRMEGADIADIYYPAFLSNGKQTQNYPAYKPGEKIRLRIINASSSSQYWITIGGEPPLLVSADGPDVVPIAKNKIFIAIAETYDFILTVPSYGKIEVRAMAQDGSGFTATYIGNGDTLKAEVMDRPDKIGMMKMMAEMDMRMGAPASKFNPSDEDPKKMMEKWGMEKHQKNINLKGEQKTMDHAHHKKMHEEKHQAQTGKHGGKMDGMNMFGEYKYDYLKSTEKTSFEDTKPVNEVLLNLTGNMWRYIWSMNGVPLSETDKIKINKGEVVRITLNNLTMMHHPMHLHGHFFRVINEFGAYAPLKHTVNVPPMQKVIIEFDAKEDNDWFFHCHVLYHMIGGMARIFSYDSLRNPNMRAYNIEHLTKDDKVYYHWGMIDIATHMTGLNLVSSNLRNQFMVVGEYGWNKNIELEFTYERYLYDYLRLFGGVNLENEEDNSLKKITPTVIGGIRFFTPYMFDLDMRIDNQLRPQLSLDRSLMLFPKLVVFGRFEYQADFGWVNNLEDNNTGIPKRFKKEITWTAGAKYFLSRNFSLMSSYDNRFGAGAGLSIRF